jgi:CheY-like chemotaxis protein
MILLVEDEPALVVMECRLLQRCGYTVLSASMSSEAIRIAQKHPGGIDLLITDVVIPEMSGCELYRTILAIQPGLRCVFISGHTAEVLAHHGNI